MAAVWAPALFTTRTVSPFLSRRNALRTEWKRGESDEIMSHGSTSRGVLLALFMAAMRHSPGAPVLLFWTLGCHLQHHASIFHLKAFFFTTEQVSKSLTEHSSSRAWPWLNRFLPIDAGSIWLVFNNMNFSRHLGIIALATGINCTRYRSCNYFACCLCNYSQIALESMWLPILIVRCV